MEEISDKAVTVTDSDIDDRLDSKWNGTSIVLVFISFPGDGMKKSVDNWSGF